MTLKLNLQNVLYWKYINWTICFYELSNKIKNFKRIARSEKILGQRKVRHLTASRSHRDRLQASACCLTVWSSGVRKWIPEINSLWKFLCPSQILFWKPTAEIIYHNGTWGENRSPKFTKFLSLYVMHSQSQHLPSELTNQCK